MHYSTKVIQIAGEECQHLKVIDKQTICGIKLLQGAQIVLKYTLDETKLCEKCKEINPIPRVKDWCPRYKIQNGDHAKSALNILYLFYQALPEQIKIGWGLWEVLGNHGYNSLITNYLVNPEPIIVNEEEKVLHVSLIGGDGRVENVLPFELIEEFMPLIREDFLEHLQQLKN